MSKKMRNMPDFYDCVRVCVWAINFTIPTFVWCNNFCLNCKTFLAQKTINWVGIKNVYRSWKLVGADVAASNCICSISIHFHYKYQQSKSEKGKADPRQSIQCRNSDTLSSPLLQILLKTTEFRWVHNLKTFFSILRQRFISIKIYMLFL